MSKMGAYYFDLCEAHYKGQCDPCCPECENEKYPPRFEYWGEDDNEIV